MCDEQRRRVEITRRNLVAPLVINRNGKEKRPPQLPAPIPMYASVMGM